MASVHVVMDNPDPVTGFEIHLVDSPESLSATLDDVVPSDELDALGGMFSVSESNGNLIVLWFSVTGVQIPSDFGDLFTVNYLVADTAADGPVDVSFDDATTFSNNVGQAMYWNGFGTSFDLGLPDIFLSLVQTGDYTFEIHMDNLELVSGFQFGVTDSPDNYTFVSASGTDRIPADWSISGNDNNGEMSMLGFSFSGSTIDVGSGAIVEVEVDHDGSDFMSELCFSTFIISNPSATQYLTIAECTGFVNPFEPPGTDD